MLARFDSEGKFESVFKPKPIEISENANNFFDKTKTWDLSVLKTKQEFENLSKAIGVTDDSLKKFLTTEEEAYKTKDLATYTKYLNDHNKTLDLATLKTKAWAFAKNMAVNAGIAFASFLISKGLQALDGWIHRAERCKERVDEMISTFHSSIDTVNSHKRSIDDIADRYEELSKGVNNLGENVSLTPDEYEEYNSIVNQIADMFPKMVQGYTDEGNAIIKLKGNVDKLREAYEEEAKAAYHALIAKGEDGDGNDIVENARDVLNGENFQVGHQDWGNVEKLKFLDKLMSATNDIGSMLELWNSSLGTSYREWFEEYAGVGGTVKIEELTPEQLADIKKNAKVMKQQFQAEIDTVVGNVETLANAYLMTSEDYATLDEQSKNAASIIVNNLSADIVAGFTSKEDVGKYVDDIVQMMSDNPQAKDALIGLFTMDTTDMPVDRVQNQVNNYIDTIAKIFGEDPVKLKVRLGFDDSDIEALKNNVKNKLKGDEFNSKVGELSEADLKIASNLDVPDDSINSWEELIKKITEAKQSDNKMTVSSSEMKTASDGLSALSSAFKQLSDDGYMSTESISKIKNAVGDGINKWEDYEKVLMRAKAGSAEFNKARTVWGRGSFCYKMLD